MIIITTIQITIITVIISKGNLGGPKEGGLNIGRDEGSKNAKS